MSGRRSHPRRFLPWVQERPQAYSKLLESAGASQVREIKHGLLLGTFAGALMAAGAGGALAPQAAA